MFHTFTRRVFLLILVSLVAACGGRGGPADPPSGFTVTPGDGQVVISWNMTSGVEYWLPYAPQAAFDSTDFTKTVGLRWLTNVSSPYVLTGLTNGQTYTFALNGRTGTGKGGALTQALTVMPRTAGTSWSPGSGITLPTDDLRGITSGTASDGVSYFLAAGSTGTLYKSSNDVTSAGLVWTPSGSVAGHLNSAIYAFSKFIVVGDDGTDAHTALVSSSADLSTWTTSTLTGTPKLNALASNGSRLVAVGNAASGAGTIVYSADGVKWVAASAPTSENLYGVSYSSSGLWLAVGANGTLLSSPDGVTWTAQASGVSTDLMGAAYRPATTVTTTLPAGTTTTAAAYVVVGAGGVVLYSTDAATAAIPTWTAGTWDTTPNVTADLLTISSLPNQFLAVGASGTVVSSQDGLTWTAAAPVSGAASLYGLTNVRSQYVAVGAAGATFYSR
ncbi:hypothetical protein [Limnohabitans sp. Jir72]|uniref:hypothetical protein n=1 Tax=Limnohabitans sp. Jir72 TaxID=1977909 RepID=UPI000D39E228|nr:hypothetical protein [Limnohabitans sp. Jir72]PUE35921.1 hypothetical protein B9Z52_01790 [Limnohabitans sp. Jir72]